MLNKKPHLSCLISAGPTREWIDPVRFISNPSSGKMGYALAQTAKELGMKVTLVSGPVSIPAPEGMEVIKVETAEEMKSAMLSTFDNANLIIMCAAVSDHRPAKYTEMKIVKDQFPSHLELARNPDILKHLGELKREDQVLVGFAAETKEVLLSAKKKLVEKNLDWIIANDVSKEQGGFSSDKNEVVLIGSGGEKMPFALADKVKIAQELLNAIYPSCIEKAR